MPHTLGLKRLSPVGVQPLKMAGLHVFCSKWKFRFWATNNAPKTPTTRVFRLWWVVICCVLAIHKVDRIRVKVTLVVRSLCNAMINAMRLLVLFHGVKNTSWNIFRSSRKLIFRDFQELAALDRIPLASIREWPNTLTGYDKIHAMVAIAKTDHTKWWCPILRFTRESNHKPLQIYIENYVKNHSFTFITHGNHMLHIKLFISTDHWISQ